MSRHQALCSALAVLAGVVATSAGAQPAPTRAVPRPHALRSSEVKAWVIPYRAHNGARRRARLLLPVWYGPSDNPPIPLIISPHGRGLSGGDNAALWGNLPTVASFAVVNPDGQGRRLADYSWGSPGQIDDLARMPAIVTGALPWLRIERRRIYAFGGSMGGQETLLLAARYPGLLAGAAAFDSVTDLALQYRNFPLVSCHGRCHRSGPLGKRLRRLARREVGGSPRTRPYAYAERSPITFARSLAFSCVPLQFWWSIGDRTVIDQRQQSGRLFWKIRRLNRAAPAQAFVGSWTHSAELNAGSRLPIALAAFGLLPARFAPIPDVLDRVVPPPSSRWRLCRAAQRTALGGDARGRLPARPRVP
jgi:pimeloyl-ACP methyl ester carboxylesterase